MKLLFIGDIVGRPGRNTVAKYLPDLIKKQKPDWVIANAENIAGGKGFTPSTLHEMMKLGVDAFTSGNHIFSNPSGFEALAAKKLPICIPANFYEHAPGHRSLMVPSKDHKKVLFLSCLLGQTFMKHEVHEPLQTLDELFEQTPSEMYHVSLVDIHAEATSEKYALKAYLDGSVSAILGTHTHVPTADADISPGKTAFQCDVGMTGSLDSCIGTRSKGIIQRMKTQLSVPQVLEKKGRMQFNAVLISFDKSGSAKKISPIRKVE